MPELSVSSELFACWKKSSGPYVSERGAFVNELAAGLSGVAVDPDTKTLIQEDYPLPDTGDYIGLWLSLGDWNPFLYIFSTGDLYVDFNGRSDGAAYHYKLEDTSDYKGLVQKLAEIKEKIEHMPLDYSFSVWPVINPIRPESESAKIFLQNNSGRPVTFFPQFKVERETDGTWRALEEIEPLADAQAIQKIPPRKSIRWGIDLTNLKGGREPGRYRISNTFSYEGEAGMPFSAEFEITADAFEISYPLPPRMTPENQEYCERYIQMWGFYNPFSQDFGEGSYPQNFHTYHLYHILSGMEGIRDEDSIYGDIPADTVEGVIARHFAVTPEQIRSLSPTIARRPEEGYDSQTNTYHFEGGYGGGSLTGIVVKSIREGDLLTLTCRWYDMDDSFSFEHEVTLRTGSNKNDFFYLKNKVTDVAGDIPNFAG